MAYLAELTDLVQLHARAQGIPRARCQEVLGRIVRAEGDEPGSWCSEWTREADRLTDAGRHLDACRLYSLARFPYPGNPGQERAGKQCVSSFARWGAGSFGIERMTLDLLGRRVPIWASGLDPAAPRPLLLMMGGIVSVKEQWAQSLPLARNLGMAAIAAEMPGVGENPLEYNRESWRMLPALFDAVAEIAPVHEIYTVAMSFSGHLALRCAAHDSRLRGLVTVGAPVADFFENEGWWSQVPTTTKRTLAHLTRRPVADVHHHLRNFALQPYELARIPVPIRYVVSRRDEIIPPEDSRTLARYVPDFAWTQFDDVHGSPNHVTRTKLWVLRSVLRMHSRSLFPLTRLGLHAAKNIAVKGKSWIG